MFLNMGGYELLILLVIPAIWIWALVDVLKSEFTSNTIKLIWIILIVFLPLFGIPLYYFLSARQKINPSNN